MDTSRLQDKGVIVTGGGSGIGRGACLGIAAEGGRVGVLDVRAQSAQQVADEINASGGSTVAVACDVAVEAEVEHAIDVVLTRWGSLRGMVANAGTDGSGWIHETTLADWQFVLGVNLTGPFPCAKHSIPHMLNAGGGSYVATSSVAGSVTGAGGAAASYAVLKAGVIQLARQIAVDYGARGIRANAIQPSGVAGSSLDRHTREDRARHSTPAAELPRPWIPLRRVGDPFTEYGATIAFLLSDDAGYITGTSIVIDGGYLATKTKPPRAQRCVRAHTNLHRDNRND